LDTCTMYHYDWTCLIYIFIYFFKI